MARSDFYTLLPLDRYAVIMGISPLHFNGGRSSATPELFAIKNSQSPIWHQFTWQATGLVSREELAIEIANAEREIAHFIGYWPAPTWVSQEVHRYTKYHRPELWGNGINSSGQFKGVKLDSGKVISGGQRAVTLIGDVAPVYTDPNSEGFDTLATITIATTITDECELKVYFTGKNGDKRWEIRPAKTKTITGGNVVFTFESWMLFDPDVVNAYPTEDTTSIDATVTANYVTSVEVYREFHDTTLQASQFFWEREPRTNCLTCAGTGCEACTLLSQNGCLQIRDANNGIIAPIPATYNTTTEQWDKSRRWTGGREPDQVKVWYRAGDISQFGLDGECYKIDMQMERVIAMLATTRLMRPFNANDNITKYIADLQTDLSLSTRNGGSFFTPEELLKNPFGNRSGEVMVYRQLKSLVTRRPRVGATV